MSADTKQEPVRRRRIEHLYVTVDACAELGGHPYDVLEKLKALYEHTGRRDLHVIDTQQGAQEKTNASSRVFLPMIPGGQTRFARFVLSNPGWTQVETTACCRQFRAGLAGIMPTHVFPFLSAAEEAAASIQKETFELMRARHQHSLHGHKVHKASDVMLHMQRNGNNIVFADALVSQAADNVMPQWRTAMLGIEALNGNTRANQKGYMAEMIAAMQDIKAYSYGLTRQFNPPATAAMIRLPTPQGGLKPDLEWLHAHAHLFTATKLPEDVEWWSQAEATQALRLTPLWPWSQKSQLTEEARAKLKELHKNTADNSYLHLFANHMPDISPPENTLYVLLTHDGPLIRQMLECSSGVALVDEKKNGKAHGKDASFVPTRIYEELGLTKRKPQEYPHQAAWVGSEFVEFVYKEVLDTLKPYIEKGERERIFDLVRANSPMKTQGSPVADVLEKALRYNRTTTRTLALAVLDETRKLEASVRADIQSAGVVTQEGRYNFRKDRALEAASALGLGG